MTKDRRERRRRTWSLATQLFLMQTMIILVALGGTGLAVFFSSVAANEEAAREEVLGLAHAVAVSPTISDALVAPNPTAVLQPLAEQIRRNTRTDFVVIMTADGIRHTHPDPAQIGGRFRGTIAPAAEGGTVIEVYTGTLGPSVRAVVPVLDRGEVRGLVAVGRTVDRVSQELTKQLLLLAGTTVVALLLAGTGSWFVSRWLRRTTQDLGPAELSRMYRYYDAVLHAVREGLLLLDRQGRLQLANDEARRLLALPDDGLGRRVDELGVAGVLGPVLAAGDSRTDEIFVTGDRVVMVSQAPATWEGVHLGTVVTLRDHTELRALVSELETNRAFADALSAQAHESANQLHTVISLIQLGRAEEALEFATQQLDDIQELTDVVLGGIGEPAVAALVLGKHATAAERGVDLTVAGDIDLPRGIVDPGDLVTIVGNLLDNAIDAAADGERPRRVRLEARAVPAPDGLGEDLDIEVADSGRGLPPGAAHEAFRHGWSTKPKDRLHARGLGLALVTQAVHRNRGTVKVTNDRGAVFTVHLPHGHTGRVPDERPHSALGESPGGLG